MKDKLSFHIPLQFAELEASADGLVWVHAAPFDSWDHPLFGVTNWTKERADRMKANFYSNVRGHEIATDFEHGMDRAKGEKASGWIKEVDVRDDGTWLGINFTETARDEIQKGEWKYFSYEFHDEWEHPHTGVVSRDVLTGGGLTNKPWIKGLMPINFSELVKENAVEDSQAGKEHSEPGSGGGGEPEPRKDDPPSKDHEPGTRENSPPVEPEASNVSDLDKQLREALGLDPDADIVKTVTAMKDEVEPLREVAKAHSEKKAFAEQYPEEFARMQRLEKKEAERDAKEFSERYAKFVVTKENEDGEQETVNTGFGFSALVLNKLEELHKKFSEGSATISDVREVLDTAIAGKGIVQYSELGASIIDESELTDDETTPQDAGRKFAEKVQEIMQEDNLDYSAAVKVAAEKHSKLFNEYRASVGR